MISVEHLTKRFGSVAAVEDLSFTVLPGSVTGFLGPNGAGKSTTLRMILGLIRPTSGASTIGGQPYHRLADPIGTVGAVLEVSDLHPGRTARNHLRWMAATSGISDQRVDEALGQVGLGDAAKRRVGTFSLGMRQRLGLAGALLGNPGVLLLDEPANGLDPEGMRWLRDFLRHLASEGRTVLISSHVLSEVAQTVDRVIVIGRGRLLSDSSLDELVARARSGVQVRSPHLDRLVPALQGRGLTVQQGPDGAAIVADTDPATVGQAAADQGVVLHELVATSANLEEIFLEMTAESGQHVTAPTGAPPQAVPQQPVPPQQPAGQQ